MNIDPMKPARVGWRKEYDGRWVNTDGEVRLGVLLSEVCEGARWRDSRYGRDDGFPCFQAVADMFEKHLRWFVGRFPSTYYARMLSRLCDKPEQRDHALAEIIAAYVVENRYGYRIREWEPPTESGTYDFSFEIRERGVLSVVSAEVKAPTWQGEMIASGASIARVREQTTPGPRRGAYDHALVVGPLVARVTRKSSLKGPTVAVMVSDTAASMHSDPTLMRALYASNGEFAGNRRLGGVITIEKGYLWAPEIYPPPLRFLPNPQALSECSLPASAFAPDRAGTEEIVYWAPAKI